MPGHYLQYKVGGPKYPIFSEPGYDHEKEQETTTVFITAEGLIIDPDDIIADILEKLPEAV